MGPRRPRRVAAVMMAQGHLRLVLGRHDRAVARPGAGRPRRARPATRWARARASAFWAGARQHAGQRDQAVPGLDLDPMSPPGSRLDRSEPATASAVIWFGLAAVPWADRRPRPSRPGDRARSKSVSVQPSWACPSPAWIRLDPVANGERDASFGSENDPCVTVSHASREPVDATDSRGPDVARDRHRVRETRRAADWRVGCATGGGRQDAPAR